MFELLHGSILGGDRHSQQGLHAASAEGAAELRQMMMQLNK